MTHRANLKGLNERLKQELDRFLNKIDCNVIQVIWNDSDVHISNSWEDSTEGTRAVFAKVKPEALTEANVRDIVQVTTMRDAPARSFYDNLHSVYCPILLNDTKIDTKIQKIIGVLDSQLGHALSSGSALGVDPFDKKVLSSILRPDDEFELWSELCNSRKYRAVARIFSDSFSQIQDRFKNLDALNFAEMEELLLDTQSVLDDVWKADDVDTKYPQHRMKHLFGVLSSAFVRAIQNNAADKGMDIWRGSFSDVCSRLREATRICTKWIEIVTELTESFWPSFASHTWNGKPYHCNEMHDYMTRLEEILRVRTTHEELTELLRESGNVEDTKGVDPFEPFETIRPLQYNRYTDDTWKDALKEFERRLQPLEHRIASNLRVRISKLSDRPKQHLREFLQYVVFEREAQEFQSTHRFRFQLRIKHRSLIPQEISLENQPHRPTRHANTDTKHSWRDHPSPNFYEVSVRPY